MGTRQRRILHLYFKLWQRFSNEWIFKVISSIQIEVLALAFMNQIEYYLLQVRKDVLAIPSQEQTEILWNKAVSVYTNRNKRENVRRVNIKQRLRSISSIDTSRNYFEKLEGLYNIKNYEKLVERKKRNKSIDYIESNKSQAFQQTYENKIKRIGRMIKGK